MYMSLSAHDGVEHVFIYSFAPARIQIKFIFSYLILSKDKIYIKNTLWSDTKTFIETDNICLTTGGMYNKFT